MIGKAANRVRPFPMRPPRAWIPWIVLGLSILMTFGFTLYIEDAVRAKDEARFVVAAAQVRNAIKNRLEIYRALLSAGAGLFMADTSVTRAEFRRFVDRQKIQSRYPGIQGIGYAERVLPAGVDSLERALRRQQNDSFAVWPAIAPNDSASRIIYTITHLEPQDLRNRRAIGFDMFSDSIRRRAMERARDTGQAVLSGRVTLVQELKSDRAGQAGFLLYTPVYSTETIPATLEERRATVRGFYYAPFRAGNFFEEIAQRLGRLTVNFVVYAGDSIDDRQLLHRSHRNDTTRSSDSPRFRSTDTLTFAGELWTIAFTSRPEFEEASDDSIVPVFALVGMLFSISLFFLSFSQVKAHEQARGVARNLQKSQEEVERLNAELEQRVAERTAELRSTNEGLESFAYSVSHDLRAPLRSIDGFSKFLLEDYSETLDETGKDYLLRMRRAAQRMSDLIDDLLDLSMVTRRPLARDNVDVTLQVMSIVEKLREEDAEREIEIVAEEGIVANADRKLLRVALHNLLENAWKFTRGTVNPCIEVGSFMQNDERVYYVRDNGVGFDISFGDSIFDSFRRLHSPSEFPGTGIGLTIVKRVISRHGGRIWAEAEVDRGATFFFTLEPTDDLQVERGM